MLLFSVSNKCVYSSPLLKEHERYMIDPGLVKATAYNSRAGVEPMEVVKLRLNNAGWGGPGKWLWLYTEDTPRKLKDTTVPKIQHCNLVNVVLQLKAFSRI